MPSPLFLWFFPKYVAKHWGSYLVIRIALICPLPADPLILILVSSYPYHRILILLSLSSSLLLLVFPYFLHFWPWPDSKVTSAGRGAKRCWYGFFSHFLLRHIKNLRFFVTFLKES